MIADGSSFSSIPYLNADLNKVSNLEPLIQEYFYHSRKTEVILAPINIIPYKSLFSIKLLINHTLKSAWKQTIL